MLIFFRKVRQKLIPGNSTAKYLGYALGEIVLVVIGILIALGINNWSEQRKSRVFEKEILVQIRENLRKDKDNLKNIIANANRAVQCSEKILALERGSPPPDSLKYWLGSIAQFDRFQPLTNAYEVLKSRGLDLLSDKELRFLMGTYYDDQAHIISNANEDLKQTFVEDWVPLMRQGVVEFKFKEYLILPDEQAFLASDKLRNILILNQSNYDGSIQYMGEGLQLINKVLEIVERELAKDEL
ncbi:DUF6090 family protein [Robiginitalea aurantiaca]|uniref:DUF6090 family protein n=1 Tax=Robiginitalea aurantiaca TaxID=3056915 RepID=A0ABT7WHV1_9FLAO|nr:DUF6090 family protein [Robiginitalea aurantiaca]MDM9632505.1 DUF6090 family protein [Robiginitalea aurantiaca]